MPTLLTRSACVVSIAVDNASAEETIAMVLLERGELERAALAFRRAQRHLADAELELLRQVRAAMLSTVTKRRASGEG